MRFDALPIVEAPKSTKKVVENMLLKKVVPTLAVGLALSMGVAAPAIAATNDPAPVSQEQNTKCHDKAFFENLGKQVADKVGDMPKGTALDTKKLMEMKDFLAKEAPELDATKAATGLYGEFQKNGLTKQAIAEAVVKAATDQGVIKDCSAAPTPGDKTEPGNDAEPADPGAEKEVKNECHDKAFFEGKIKQLLTSWGEKVTFGNFGSEEAKADVKAGFDEFLPGANFDKAYKYIKGAFEAKTWSNSANLEAAIMDALVEQGLVSDSCEVPGLTKPSEENATNASVSNAGDQTVLEGQDGEGLAQTGSVIGLSALGALACGAGAAGSFVAARRKAAQE